MPEEKKPKFGAGHFSAWMRAGTKELAQILPAFPGQGVHPVEEPGLAGNPTNIEVVRDKEQQGIHGPDQGKAGPSRPGSSRRGPEREPEI